MNDKQRYDWVDAAKGLSIILVVMMYAAYNVGEHTNRVGGLHYLIGFATPFRMPEFFLISGLFLSRVIARPWRAYADRRAVHYLYFYVLWAAIDIVLKVAIAGRDPSGAVAALAIALVDPYGVLWFIYMLAVFSVTSKLLWQLRVPNWAVLTAAACLQMTQYQSQSYLITQFCAYFLFFHLGYVAWGAVFRIVEHAQARPRLALAALAIWAILVAFLVFWPDGRPQPMAMQMGYAAFAPLHLALAVAGAVALCVLARLLLMLPVMDWLRWLGEHSLVVYLAFTLPMSAARIILTKTVTGTTALGLAVLVISIAAPIILYLAIQATGIGRFLFERPGWARIAPRPGEIPRQAAPLPAE